MEFSVAGRCSVNRYGTTIIGPSTETRDYLADISVYFFCGPVTKLFKNPEVRPIYGGGKIEHIII